MAGREPVRPRMRGHVGQAQRSRGRGSARPAPRDRAEAVRSAARLLVQAGVEEALEPVLLSSRMPRRHSERSSARPRFEARGRGPTRDRARRPTLGPPPAAGVARRRQEEAVGRHRCSVAAGLRGHRLAGSAAARPRTSGYRQMFDVRESGGQARPFLRRDAAISQHRSRPRCARHALGRAGRAATPSFSVSPSGPRGCRHNRHLHVDLRPGSRRRTNLGLSVGLRRRHQQQRRRSCTPSPRRGHSTSLTVTGQEGNRPSAPGRSPSPPTVSFTARPNVALIGQQVTFTPVVDRPGRPSRSALELRRRNDPPGNGCSDGRHGRSPLAGATGGPDGDRQPRSHRAGHAQDHPHPRAPTAAPSCPRPSRSSGRGHLSSYSSDPDGPLEAQVWDLDGDGAFDDASGARVVGAFTTPGPHTVSLRVRDADGVGRSPRRSSSIKVSNWLAPITPTTA